PTGAPSVPFAGSSSSSFTGSKLSPMELAGKTSPKSPTGEFEEPPTPTIESAPKSPVPPGKGGSIANLALNGNTLTVTLNKDSSSTSWQTQYDYKATLTQAQISKLKSGNPSSIAQTLQGLQPPPAYQCTNAANTLTHFPSNMNLFQKEFPAEYDKFMTNLETGIFQQIHAQQEASNAKMKEIMQKMEQS
ncbi:MAG: hypothetical protein WCN87_04840, partial [Chlamydiota bacterium]